MDITPLDGRTERIPIDPFGYELLAPGLLGSVQDRTSEATRSGEQLRSSGRIEESVQEAFIASEINVDKIFEISIEEDLTPVRAGDQTRSDGTGCNNAV